MISNVIGEGLIALASSRYFVHFLRDFVSYLPCLGMAAALGISAYFLRAKSIDKAIIPEVRSMPRFRYPRWARRIARIGVIGIPTAAAVLLLLSFKPTPPQAGVVRVLVVCGKQINDYPVRRGRA